MNKLLLFLSFALCSTIASAQISWEIKGGPSLNTSFLNFSSEVKAGGRFGVGMEYPISRIFSLQSGLMINFKGSHESSTITAIYKNSDQTSTIKRKEKSCHHRQDYLELPINALFRFPLHHSNAIRIAFGPYFAYGVAGNAKSTTTRTVMTSFDDQTSMQPVSTLPDVTTVIIKGGTFDHDGLNYRRFDFGINTSVYFEHKQYFLGIYEELGLVNLHKRDYGNAIDNTVLGSKNLSLGIEIGYRF